MRQPDSPSFALLVPGVDPPPVEVLAPHDPAILLVCEHAGRALPQTLGDLGLPPSEMDRHIAWDIGAEGVARALAERLGAALVVQRYSRLVIDCNRPPLGTGSVPGQSDGTMIPGNHALTPAQAKARVREIFDPFAAACAGAAQALALRALYSIHSFTPRMNGTDRPWHIGFCARDPAAGADTLAAAFGAAHPDLTVAVNEPYQIDDDTDWFIPRIAEPTGLPHALIEIRNDQIATPEGQHRWAGWLADLLSSQHRTTP